MPARCPFVCLLVVGLALTALAAPATGAPRDPWDELEAVARQSQRRTGRTSWRVLNTANFRVYYLSVEELARRLAGRAERLRADLFRYWTDGAPPPRPWSDRCEIFVYASYRELVVMTGGAPKSGSARVRPSRLYRGRILSRRMDLHADDSELLDATLPHEIAHLVLGDLLAGEVPMWANEGAATRAESARKQRHYRRVLARFLPRVYPLGVLLETRVYPEAPFTRLFYAQSASLVDLLLQGGTPGDLIEFLALARRRGYDHALRRVYNLAGLEELQQLWRSSISRSPN